MLTLGMKYIFFYFLITIYNSFCCCPCCGNKKNGINISNQNNLRNQIIEDEIIENTITDTENEQTIRKKSEIDSFIKNDLENLKNKLKDKNKDIDKLRNEELYLINLYLKENNIKNIESILIEGILSLNKAIKISINGDKIIYIKKCNFYTKIFYDLLKEIGLLDFKYYFSLTYVASEHVEQNIENEDINIKYLKIDKSLETKNLKKMLSKIENFKEYNFFCALLGLGDCNLIYRLDNSYFKKTDKGYKVYLLDVDFPSSSDRNCSGEGYSRFYDVLSSKTVILSYFDSFFRANREYLYKYEKFSDELLVALAISFIMCENSIEIFDESVYENAKSYQYLKSLSKNGDNVKNPAKLNCKFNGKQFIEYVCTNNDFLYKPENGLELLEKLDHPENFTCALEEIFKKFKIENNKDIKDEIEKKFLDFIIPVLYNCGPSSQKGKKKSPSLDEFKEKFLENYKLSKNCMFTVNKYYLAQGITKENLITELLSVDKFTEKENKEIKEKLIRLISFINTHKEEYKDEYISYIKSNFRFLKSNNMFPKIISDVNF